MEQKLEPVSQYLARVLDQTSLAEAEGKFAKAVAEAQGNSDLISLGVRLLDKYLRGQNNE